MDLIALLAPSALLMVRDQPQAEEAGHCGEFAVGVPDECAMRFCLLSQALMYM